VAGEEGREEALGDTVPQGAFRVRVKDTMVEGLEMPDPPGLWEALGKTLGVVVGSGDALPPLLLPVPPLVPVEQGREEGVDHACKLMEATNDTVFCALLGPVG
jgi:hypothetical protein